MDKMRTIYRLRALRGGLIMAFLSILWGSVLLFMNRLIPDTFSAKIRESVAISGKLTDMSKIEILEAKAVTAHEMLLHAAFEPVLFGMMTILVLFLLIRLNGNTKLRIAISWIIGAGTIIYSLGLFIKATTFLSSASMSNACDAGMWFIIPGILLLSAGLLLTFVKTIKDLTEPVGVA